MKVQFYIGRSYSDIDLVQNVEKDIKKDGKDSLYALGKGQSELVIPDRHALYIRGGRDSIKAALRAAAGLTIKCEGDAPLGLRHARHEKRLGKSATIVQVVHAGEASKKGCHWLGEYKDDNFGSPKTKYKRQLGVSELLRELEPKLAKD
jgi:hypothetical protein